MIRHLFKLIWNKKKQNSLLITEIFVSFLVLFAVFTLVVYAWGNYRQPMNFDHDNVWAVSFTPPAHITGDDSIATFHEAIKNTVQSMPQVAAVSYCSQNIPFSMSSMNTSVTYGKISGSSNLYEVDEDYLEVLDMKLEGGRWLTRSDAAAKTPAVVINTHLAQELFGTKDPLGKKIGDGTQQMQVVGVVATIKDAGSYQSVGKGMYKLTDRTRSTGMMLLELKPGADAAFESKLFKTLSDAIGTSIEIEHLDKKLVSKNKIMLVPMIIAFIVAGFLIINVALGLFGVLWYNINKRRGEIGLRRALGAPGKSIAWQLVAEAMVLSTLALILGTFFAVQFPLLNVFDLDAGTYVAAIVLAVLSIYVLVLACAVYPGRQAAAILPAVALHED